MEVATRTDVIEVQPARSPPDATWLGGEPDCPHPAIDPLAQYGVCRDCGAATLEQAVVPEAFLVADQQ